MRGRAVERGEHLPRPRSRSCSTSAVSITSWLVSAPMHMPGRLRRARRDPCRQPLDQRDETLPARRPPVIRVLPRSDSRARPRRASATALEAGITPADGQRLGERHLDVEHRLHAADGVKRRRWSWTWSRTARRYRSKNTVSPGALHDRCRDDIAPWPRAAPERRRRNGGHGQQHRVIRSAGIVGEVEAGDDTR